MRVFESLIFATTEEVIIVAATAVVLAARRLDLEGSLRMSKRLGRQLLTIPCFTVLAALRTEIVLQLLHALGLASHVSSVTSSA